MLITNVRYNVSDGNNITHSKPDPEVFLKAAEMLGIAPENCMIVEDADAGIEAGKRAGIKRLPYMEQTALISRQKRQLHVSGCL